MARATRSNPVYDARHGARPRDSSRPRSLPVSPLPLRRRRTARGSVRSPGGRGSGSRWRPRAWLGLAALGLVVAVAVAARLSTPRRTAPPAVADPALASTDARSMYLRGVELARAGRHRDALPFLRRALALRGDLWQVHLDLASVLFNSGLETRTLRGVEVPASRSSWERIAAAREALDHLRSAEALAAVPADRARVPDLRARRRSNWGLAWDALDDFRAAARVEPAARERGDEVRRQLAVMEHPELPVDSR